MVKFEIFILFLTITSNNSYYSVKRKGLYLRNLRKPKSVLNFNQTVFTALDNYEENATPVAEDKYPWIARVVHSKTANIPHVCTASCIRRRIFITAAVCIHSLKIHHTTVIYQYGRLPVKAFVIPKNGSRQSFEDIGFIIVNIANEMEWSTIELFNTVNRTDETFEWFSKLFRTNKIEHKVIGFAVPKILEKVIIAEKQFYLTELPVIVNIKLCSWILTFNKLIDGFNVPCYHSCSVDEYNVNATNCHYYHGVEGGAIVNIKTNKLLGVATWGPTHTQPLPVGFAIPNSPTFFKNYECAKRIRNDEETFITVGHYQRLCDE